MSDTENKASGGSLVPKPAEGGGGLTKTGTGFKVGIPKLHQRIAKAEVAASGVNPLTMANRIGLMLDVSGSMAGTPIDDLKNACQAFLAACDFGNTAIAIETFGSQKTSQDLLAYQPVLMMTVAGLSAGGGTPLARAMNAVLNLRSISRGVVVSDGEPDSAEAAYEEARAYAAAEIPIDTVHIGDDESGAHVLKEIARITGGLYIKFNGTANFAQAFHYLTPRYRAMLAATNPEERKRLLGAEDVS